LTPIPGSADHPGQLQESELTFGDTKPELLLISASRADGVVTSGNSGLLAPRRSGKILLDKGHQICRQVVDEIVIANWAISGHPARQKK